MEVKSFIRNIPGLFRTVRAIKAFHIGFAALLAGRRGALDHISSTVSMACSARVVWGRPINVTIEPANICNLRCPVCETGAGQLKRPAAQMNFDQFKTIIDKISSHTNTLMFYFMGESFLNRDAYRMIRYAKDAKIPFVTTCTNGDVINPGELVNSGIDEVSFQIGGVVQETHETYRIGSRLEKVLANLAETIRLRNKHRPMMRIVCGFILMRHNEHEVSEFKALMTRIGVDEAIVVDPCVRTVEQAKQMLPTDPRHWYYDQLSLEQGILKPKMSPHNECPWLYYSMTIQVNGDVVPCCRDVSGQFVMGNILQQNLEEIWNGKEFQSFRNRLRSEQRKITICSLCSGYGVSRIS